MKLHKFRFALICISALFSAACNTPSRETEKEEHHRHTHDEALLELSQAQINTVGIELVSPSRRPMGHTLRTAGVIEADPRSFASVSTLFPGIIKRINVIAGERVAEGETLAMIENSEIIALQQDYLEAINNRELALTELDRQKRLNAEGAGILKNLQQAENAANIASVKADGLAAQLRAAGLSPASVSAGALSSLVPVKSPINGIVSKVDAVTGAYASTSEPLFSVINPNGLYALLYVYGSDIQYFKPGMKTEVVVSGADAPAIEGEVEQINSTLDSETKAMTVRLKLNIVKNEILAPGMTLKAFTPLDAKECDALPESSFYSTGGKDYVFMLSSSHEHDGETVCEFEQMEVVKGASMGGFTAFTPAAGQPVNPDRKFATNAFYLGSAVADHGEHDH